MLPELKQFSIADILNEKDNPLEIGEYVEHQSKPGFILEIVSCPYQTLTGKEGIKVKDREGNVFPVLLELLRRYM